MKAKRSKVVKNEHVRTAHFSEHLDSSDAHSYTHATQIPRGSTFDSLSMFQIMFPEMNVLIFSGLSLRSAKYIIDFRLGFRFHSFSW